MSGSLVIFLSTLHKSFNFFPCRVDIRTGTLQPVSEKADDETEPKTVELSQFKKVSMKTG